MFPGKETRGAKSLLGVKSHRYRGGRPVGVTSTVPGVCNGLSGWEEEGPGPESCSDEGGVGMGIGGWLCLSQTLLRIRVDIVP